MERESYQKRINDLLDGLESLLNANVKMGERIEKLEEKVKDYDDLKDKYEKLKGELAMRKRDKYGKGGEKPKDDTSSSNNDKTKDEDEEDYINNGSKNDVPPVEDSEEEESVSSEPPAKKERDLSNRPDHYKKIIELIGVLYKVELESILLHRTEAEVLEARKTESIPILNELDQKSALLLAKVKSKELKISSKLEHALNYMRNHWKELIAYIDIGNVLIDNNCCERAVLPFTNLRKSFGGFSSELGGEVAAAWLTFVETCKLQKKAAL